MRAASLDDRSSFGLVVAALALLAALLGAGTARAHGGDASYVVLTPRGATITGSLSLDLADVEKNLGVSRVDLIAGRRRDVLAGYLVGHLRLGDGRDACPIEPAPADMTFDEKVGQLALPFVARCVRPPERLAVDFELFFRAPGTGVLRLDGPHRETRMFTTGQPSATFVLDAAPTASGPLSAVRVGVVHIWSGADHMLFLLALLMTSVVVRTPRGWVARASLRDSLVDVAKIVSGFTLTHSVTLTLAALGILRPAPRLIEPAIAASVAVAAFDNLRPFLRGRKWVIASSLGLLHGFGFAAALDELKLPKGSLLVTLCGFGLGVEIGQMIFVAAFVPLAFALRDTQLYRRWVVQAGSVVIAVVALVWMIQRAR